MHVEETEIPSDYVLMGVELGTAKIPGATEAEAREISKLKTHPIVQVNSVIVPRESNYILYPEAPGLDATVLFVEPFAFDTRLFVATRVV